MRLVLIAALASLALASAAAAAEPTGKELPGLEPFDHALVAAAQQVGRDWPAGDLWSAFER